MDFLSNISISPIILLLFGVIFLLFVFEIFYLLKKRKKQPSSSFPSQPQNIASQPILQPQNAPQNLVIPPQPKQQVSLKFVLPVVGIIVLGGVVVGGVYYLQKPDTSQDIRSRAETCPNGYDCYSPSSLSVDCTSDQNGQTVQAKLVLHKFSDENTCKTVDPKTLVGDPGLPGDIVGSCTTSGGDGNDKYPTCNIGGISVPDCSAAQLDCTSSGQGMGPGGSVGVNCNNCNPQPTNTPKPTKPPTPTKPGPSPIPTLTGVPTPTNTPPPGTTPPNTPIPLSAACVNLNFYKVSGNDLFSEKITLEDLKNLQPGEKVNITVLGNLQSQVAQLRINQSAWSGLPLKRPVPSRDKLIEYYDSNVNKLFDIAKYPNITNFTIQGQVLAY